MEIIYGTKNKAKLEDMRKILADIDIEITGLSDTGISPSGSPRG